MQDKEEFVKRIPSSAAHSFHSIPFLVLIFPFDSEFWSTFSHFLSLSFSPSLSLLIPVFFCRLHSVSLNAGISGAFLVPTINHAKRDTTTQQTS